MKISRSDQLYVEIDKIENHSIQYKVFLEMIDKRLHFQSLTDLAQKKIEYINFCKIKEHLNLPVLREPKVMLRECIYDDTEEITATIKKYESLLGNEQISVLKRLQEDRQAVSKKEYFIDNHSYINNPEYQVWINFDLSMPKEMLIAQIEQIKEDADQNKIDMSVFKSKNKISTKYFITHIPLEFSKSIKRQYGDFLYIVDCKILGYKYDTFKWNIDEYRQSIGNNKVFSSTTKKRFLNIFRELEIIFESSD